MSDFTDANQNSYWDVISKIKKILDPNNIISPGKYLFNI